jgi:hypothetical protein
MKFRRGNLRFVLRERRAGVCCIDKIQKEGVGLNALGQSFSGLPSRKKERLEKLLGINKGDMLSPSVCDVR